MQVFPANIHEKPIFYKLFDVLLNEISESHSELKTGKDLIVETLKNEEEKIESYLSGLAKVIRFVRD